MAHLIARNNISGRIHGSFAIETPYTLWNVISILFHKTPSYWIFFFSELSTDTMKVFLIIAEYPSIWKKVLNGRICQYLKKRTPRGRLILMLFHQLTLKNVVWHMLISNAIKFRQTYHEIHWITYATYSHAVLKLQFKRCPWLKRHSIFTSALDDLAHYL